MDPLARGVCLSQLRRQISVRSLQRVVHLVQKPPLRPSTSYELFEKLFSHVYRLSIAEECKNDQKSPAVVVWPGVRRRGTPGDASGAALQMSSGHPQTPNCQADRAIAICNPSRSGWPSFAGSGQWRKRTRQEEVSHRELAIASTSSRIQRWLSFGGRQPPTSQLQHHPTTTRSHPAFKPPAALDLLPGAALLGTKPLSTASRAGCFRA
ncbi:uncharacterized protein BKA78DRAFT_299401 [Phyllosticta capitalensis]|uniref:uncharacterized protein n=1 Tax=Phyllosticta capitalensis TaxID=121624 RepID=UPI0031328CC4